MAKVSPSQNSGTTRSRRPALSPEARENQMIALAVDLAEKQLQEGTASSQVITHYLKMGSIKERLEREKIEEENKLLKAKTKALQDAADMKELYAEAIMAMKRYSGHGGEEEEEEYDY